MTEAVTIEDVRAAARRIAGQVIETPFVHSRTLSEIFGAELHLKLENLQYTASFKERGALNRLLALSPPEREAGVIAMSAGNHAQAVAYHATRLGIAATIVMPRNTPSIKVVNTERLGAEVVLHGDSLSEASTFCDQLAATGGRVLIHPYDDPAVIAGQGTVAIEMLNARPDLEVLAVPIGGGGLISGCAVAAKALAPGVELLGVEAALYPAMRQVLRAEPVTAHGPTIAEGIAVKEPGRLTRAIVAALVAEILLVEEAHLEQAVQLIAEIEKLVAEGAGAAGLAAVMAYRERFAGRRVGLIVSGGNIDARLLASVLMRGLARSGRLVRIRVQVSDLPGSLGSVTQEIGALGGNIVEVEHERWFYDVPVKLTELDFLIETRDRAHGRAILAGLTEAGVPARLLSATALEENGDQEPSTP